MKILHIGNFAGKGNPWQECPHAQYVTDTLVSLGQSVTSKHCRDTTLSEALALAKSHDLVLAEELRLKDDYLVDKENKVTILGRTKELVQGPVPVVSWCNNLYWSLPMREIELKTNPIFRAKILFSTDGGHDEKWKSAGINHRLLRQGIFQDEAYISKDSFPTMAKVGFIGSIYSFWEYRSKLISFLKEKYGSSFGHFGADGSIRHKLLNDLCSTLKIIVGDSVYSPRYWSNRCYEIIGRGGFLISPRIEGFDEEFLPYKHYIPYTFNDFDGLKEKIDYFLTHDAEREKIRRAGFEHCKANHTYKHRVVKLLETLKDEGII